MKPKTRVAIVLDKSGSMESTKKQAIEGLNEQIQQAKERANTQDLRCSIVTFNGDVFEHVWDIPPGELMEAEPGEFVPNGATAMRDALGYTVQKLIATEGDDREAAYLVYVISDGQTNSDVQYSPQALRSLVEACQATGRWTFTYMGCADALEQVQAQTGVPLANMATWDNTSGTMTTRAFGHQKGRMKKYLDSREMGATQSEHYSSDTSEAADFTAPEPAEEAPAPAPVEPVRPSGPAPDLRALSEGMPQPDGTTSADGAGNLFGHAARKAKWRKGG